MTTVSNILLDPYWTEAKIKAYLPKMDARYASWIAKLCNDIDPRGTDYKTPQLVTQELRDGGQI